jgi:hypothetical protein
VPERLDVEVRPEGDAFQLEVCSAFEAVCPVQSDMLLGILVSISMCSVVDAASSATAGANTERVTNTEEGASTPINDE